MLALITFDISLFGIVIVQTDLLAFGVADFPLKVSPFTVSVTLMVKVTVPSELIFPWTGCAKTFLKRSLSVLSSASS